ncbi:hypothetical protein [Zavarzinia sp.]|uniref:hypothetical protein n=1 Tax=Zavarzinia sp. TaxID=2027920 RepID=UPI00356141BC
MKKSVFVAGILVASSSLGGCVSVFEGTSQDISVNTTPAGATCVFEREQKSIGTLTTTPGTLTVRKSKYDITIRCDKTGYQQASAVNHSGVSAAIAANIAVDILFTAGISSIVDSANGADNKYDPVVNLTLVPIGAPASPMASASSPSAVPPAPPVPAAASASAAPAPVTPAPATVAPAATAPVALTPAAATPATPASAAPAPATTAPATTEVAVAAPAQTSAAPVATPPATTPAATVPESAPSAISATTASTGGPLESRFADKTVYALGSGGTYVDYYAPGGKAVRKEANCMRAGTWSISDDHLCLQFPSQGSTTTCYAVTGTSKQPEFRDAAQGVTAPVIRTQLVSSGNAASLPLDTLTCH